MCNRVRRSGRATLRRVSELLPNLESLIDELSGVSAGMQDARRLAEAARGAASEEALDQALANVVEEWRRV